MHQLEEREKVDRETREACHFDQVSCFSPTYHILHCPREIVIVKWHFFPALSERRISSSLEANTRSSKGETEGRGDYTSTLYYFHNVFQTM
jgi:hypothetical protein